MPDLRLVRTDDSRVLCIGRISGERSTHEERKREHYTALIRRWRLASDNGAPETTLRMRQRLQRYGVC